MKQQPQKTSRQVELLLSEEEARIMANILDFAMAASDHFPVGPAFSHESAYNAVEKIEVAHFSFTRSELRSMIDALDYSSAHMNDDSDFVLEFEKYFPGVLAFLQASAPSLKPIRPRLSAAAAKLSRQK